MIKKDFIQPLNPIVTNLAPDGLLDFQKAVRDIPDLVRLTFGEPGFNVDDAIKERIIESVREDNSHYAESQGERELRNAAVEYFNKKYDLNYDGEDNMIVTIGVSEAINVVFLTLLNDNEGVIVPEPAYPPYFASLDLAHGTKISINTRPTKFKLTPEQVDEAMANAKVPVKAILFNYPSNPTGVTYSEDELIALAEVFKKHRLWVISDEIYSQLTYDQKHVSLAKLIPDQTILITGLSKSHAMTGYRIGFILGEKSFIDYAQKVHGALTFSLPKVLQDGAVFAVTTAAEVADEMRDIYKRRRDWLRPQLEELGFEMVNPEGAFYIFAKIPEDMGKSGFDFAVDLAEKAKVAIIPGDAFSEYTPEFVRISYAASDEDLAEAMKRMKAYFAERRGQ
ncbi:aspartate aminotransferase [Weissella confusa]|uniref:aminotransferase class I/II-fold pyridoxal phosphate-dependent enzyme n=1 Tax=Weissella confusa TaxID=1583 RepID=UPI0010807A95|nr:aminotransferase class I/II-fold pyridoxal phosphate-dependent enzyme [Weissella confusa]MBJ7636003.1 aminotransferase class I/II-fold pyridoxal phosphate-dependent enzyme [Weissella confusa]TGE48414.1 aspartate aminotransferase [Weissella confusa]